MNASNHHQLLTPDQLIHKYPQLEYLGWNATKIGTFFSAGLLIGWRKHEKSFILESSFKDLIDYYNNVVTKCRIDLDCKKHSNVATPEELLFKYPQVVHVWDWNTSKIGVFFNSGLLRGYRNGKENKALIQEISFEELIRFTNRVARSRNVNL